MKQTITTPINEEKANVQLLEINGGILKGVTSPDKLIGSLVLPDDITEIGVNAFQNCHSLTSITIPDSVTKIGFGAFQYCSSLTRIAISKSVTDIRSKAFAGCTCLMELTVDSENPVYCSEGNSMYTKDRKRLIAAAAGLEHIVILEGVTEIGMFAFQNCSSLTSITIPASVIKIDPWTFRGCTGLTGITMPSRVTIIGENAFSECTCLTELTVDSKNPVYYSENNIIYTKDKKKLVAAAGSLKGHIIIPDGVTEICSCAFSGCASLTSVTIPASVIEIAEYAFSGCTGLTGIIIPDSVTVIGEGAFSDCTGLTALVIPASVIKIELWAFAGCTCLTELSVDSANPVYYSENNIIYTKDKKKLVAAAGSLKGHIIIPDGVTEICSCAFSGCASLTSVTIPASVIEIGALAFKNCTSLKNIVIHGSVYEYNISTFFYINPDVHFTVKNEMDKKLLINCDTSIRDEQITVKPEL